MRLMDLLDEGLKRSMDKLKEKERDKVRGRWRRREPARYPPPRSSNVSQERRRRRKPTRTPSI